MSHYQSRSKAGGIVFAERFDKIEQSELFAGYPNQPIWLVTDEYGRQRLISDMDFSCEFIEVSAGIEVKRTDLFADVLEFAEKFGLTYDGDPRELPEALAQFRHTFDTEEEQEYLDGEYQTSEAFAASKDWYDGMEKMLDALVDRVYILLGTAALHGFNFNEAWRRVHRANMAKVRAERADQSKRGSTFDVVKPQGWVAPDHHDLVRPRNAPK